MPSPDLTPLQWDLVRGLVARATEQERARVERMTARPRGAHTPESIYEAERLLADFAELDSLLDHAFRR